ncbi:SRPBCC family protein [Aciditerrimonas ferrireducens]|jgi:hypothetical protein|uniref:SRPBCC family protein n=1 Tax=Aciditerrimonas ferrireducens TaxID=667306 RepID=A0ABV6C5T1_9ACTN
MGEVRAEARQVVPGTPQAAYDHLADLAKRRALLPEAWRDLAVEQGGRGAGTVFRVTLVAGGRERQYRMALEEPEPGRRLLERDLGSSLRTTYTLEPAPGGGCEVQVVTTWQGASGIGGFFERRFAPRALAQVHQALLANLAAALRGGEPG